jgi:hypothetical protein
VADARGPALDETIRLVLDELERQVEVLALRLDALVSDEVVRARAVELVDAAGRVRVRLAALPEEERLGLELLRPDGSLCLALSDLSGEASLVFVGGEHGSVVLELGAGDEGARLVVVQPGDELGAQAVDLAPRFR